MIPDSSDIYLVRIFFSETSGPYKSRPVLILDNDGLGNYLIAEITSVPPKNPSGYYDLAKEQIYDWLSYGLEKPSYVKCKNVYRVSNLRLFTKIGTMKDTDEFERIVNIIDEWNG